MNFQAQIPSLSRMAAALGLSCALCAAAEPVLDLTLDDPKGMIKSKPDGISALSPEFSPATATIASGFGGRALPAIDLNPQPPPAATPPALKIIGDGSLGANPFLRMELSAASTAKSIGVAIQPSTGATSFSAIYKGDGTMDGGFDFFFRVTKGSQEDSPRIVFHTRLGPFEMSLKPGPKLDGIGITFISRDPILDNVSGKTGPRPSIFSKTLNPIPIESGDIYHLAALFQTAGDGTLSIKVFLEKGLGEIHPDSSTGLNSSVDFKIAKPVADPGIVGKAVLSLGPQTFAQTLDVADFRIFVPAPKVFPALAAKK